MITQEDLDFYFKKSKDDEIFVDNLVQNEHGFLSWRVYNDKLILLNVYGDGKYWDVFSMELAKKLGINKIIAGTKRKPKAWKRKYGYEVTGYILEKRI